MLISLLYIMVFLDINIVTFFDSVLILLINSKLGSISKLSYNSKLSSK